MFSKPKIQEIVSGEPLYTQNGYYYVSFVAKIYNIAKILISK